MIAAIVHDIADTWKLRRSGIRFEGACPKCGGSGTSNKFQIRDDGGFKCWSCDFKGDIITWLREIDGLRCPDAHERAGMACNRISCPVRGTCRKGDGSGRKAHRRHDAAIPARRQETTVGSRTADNVSPEWSAWATDFVDRCHRALLRNAAEMAYLAGRGIDAQAVARFRHGWHRGNGKVDRARIGLGPRDDGKTELWTPAGLVIAEEVAGLVCRIKIRRPEADRERFLPDLKYVAIEGGAREPLFIVPEGAPRGAVIVEAELDAQAVAAAHGEVVVVALGTVANGITAEQRKLLDGCRVILIALDADGPGAKAVAAWQRSFRQAVVWPVPMGKDPGDYVGKHGGDLAAWVEAGLMPGAPAVEAGNGKKHDEELLPDSREGGQGERFHQGKQYADDVEELAALLRDNPVRVVKRDGEVRLSGSRSWAAENSDAFARLSELVFRSELCGWVIEKNPALIIDGSNLMAW